MELRQLASFLAVVEEGQFARAANRLFLSPAAVTGHIRRLESEMGIQLLQRSPVVLTVAGERLIPHARAMLAAANAASDAVADVSTDAGTRIRVGVMVPGSAELTPLILRAYQNALPHMRVIIKTLTFAEHLTALTDHRVDAAFLRPEPEDERIAVDVLTTEPRVLIVPSASPLADADSVGLTDVLDMAYVDLPDGTPQVFKDYLYFASARNGTPPRRGPDQAMTLQDVFTSVSAGRGTGAGLASFARLYRWPGVRFVPITDAPWQQTVLATRADDRRPQTRTLRALAVTVAHSLRASQPA